MKIKATITVCPDFTYISDSTLDKYEVYQNKDCYSNDLPGVEGIEMDECDQICMAYDNCMGITYTTHNRKCHPKNACPELVDLSNAVSYRLKSECLQSFHFTLICNALWEGWLSR